jgi:hypothetical protein
MPQQTFEVLKTSEVWESGARCYKAASPLRMTAFTES